MSPARVLGTESNLSRRHLGALAELQAMFDEGGVTQEKHVHHTVE